MAAKEPTVERRHELLAEEALGPAEALFQGEYSEAIDRIAQALAAAEQAASERVWDEGYEQGHRDGTADALHHARRIGDKNPYRQPKGTTK